MHYVVKGKKSKRHNSFWHRLCGAVEIHFARKQKKEKKCWGEKEKEAKLVRQRGDGGERKKGGGGSFY